MKYLKQLKTNEEEPVLTPQSKQEILSVIKRSANNTIDAILKEIEDYINPQSIDLFPNKIKTNQKSKKLREDRTKESVLESGQDFLFG